MKDKKTECKHCHDEEHGCACCEEKLTGEHEDGEIRSQIIKIVLAGVLFAASFFVHGTLEHVILIVSYLIVGTEVLVNAVKDLIKEHSVDEEFLMSIATIGAWAIGECKEAAAVMLFYAVGELLEDVACERSRKSITSLLDLRPDEITLKVDGKSVVKPLEEANVGDVALFSAGERISVDGIILSGETAVDNSALTGESLPEEKKPGDQVYGGGINTSGTIEVEITKPYSESSSARILELVENAQEKKAKTERFITKFAKKYTLIVIVLALFVAFVCPAFTGYSDTFLQWFYRGLTLLVVSCPCAFVISVPLSFFAGIGCASRNGILVKGAASVETLSKLDAVALDKTGTITKGNLSVVSVNGGDDILKLAAHAEMHSSHPIGKAIVSSYGGTLDESAVKNVTEEAGKGVSAEVYGKKVFVGRTDNSGAGLSVSVKVDGEPAGEIFLKDELKPDSKAAISELKSLGISEVVMLSGDKESSAKEVAEAVGTTGYRASLTPEGKCGELERIKKESGITAFVGDGINDAPVLAAADIGAAMGGLGSDAAIETADIVILDDKISRLPTALKIAKKTMRTVYQCTAFAFIAKAVVISLEIAGYAGMWAAVFADVGVTVLCILNSLRALNYKVSR